MEVPLYKNGTWTSPEYHSECVKVLSSAMQGSVVIEEDRRTQILQEFQDNSNLSLYMNTKIQRSYMKVCLE